MRSYLLTVAIGVAVMEVGTAHAYCLEKSYSPTNYAKWSTTTVSYRISSNLKDAAILGAIDKAFQTWGSVKCSSLRFTKAPAFNITTPARQPGKHISVYWVTDAKNWVPGVNSKSFAFMFRMMDANGASDGVALVFNAFNVNWNATGGNASTFDVQNVLTYYAGKAVGLADSKVPAATMYPNVNVYGQTSKRTLTADDIAGVTYLYLTKGCTAPAGPGGDGCSGSAPPVHHDAGAHREAGVHRDAGTAHRDSGHASVDRGVAENADSLITADLAVTSAEAGAGGACRSSVDCPNGGICSIEGRCVYQGAALDEGGCAVGGSSVGGAGLVLLLALPLVLCRRRARPTL